MLFERLHNSNPKEAILKEIYHDNLRMDGLRPADARLVKRPAVYRRLVWLLPIALAVVLCPLFSTDPSLSVNANTGRTTLSAGSPVVPADPVPSPEPEPAVGPAFALNSGPAGPLVSAAPGPAKLPIRLLEWEVAALADQNLTDYSLLLSRDNNARLSSLFGLAINTIVIDPGHGGTDPGAIGARGTKEKDITLDVASRLKERLYRTGNYMVLLTRDGDQTLSLAERVAFAKENKADLFISVHVNALPNRKLNVIETYYFGPPLNAETLQVAEQENKESHYSIGALNAIIQDIGNTVKRQESAMLAAAIQQSLLENVRHQDAHVRDWGIKTAPFVVLSQVEAPSVLVEMSCLTKKKEEVKLASPDYREKLAAFMEEGIVAYLKTQQFKIITGENRNE